MMYELILEDVTAKNCLPAITALNKFWGIHNDTGYSVVVAINGIDLTDYLVHDEGIFHLGTWDIPRIKPYLIKD